MSTPPTRQAAVDAALQAIDNTGWPDGKPYVNLASQYRRELATNVADAVFASMAGDLFIDENGVCDTTGGLHLVRDDTSPQVWALLEAVLPRRDES
jgi:hypothetical protein